MEQTTLESPGHKAVLRSAKDLFGDTVTGVEGDLGRVDDLFFDDEQWVIRYFVLKTGPWLEGRRVLISPMALRQPEWGWPRLWVSLREEDVRAAPSLDLSRPLSRDAEREVHAYYGWQQYWGSTSLWGPWRTPAELVAGAPEAFEPEVPEPETPSEPSPEGNTGEEPAAPRGSHMCSVRRAIGFGVEATDGEVGGLDDLIVDGETWQVRYMVVTTGHWFGRRILLAPQHIRRVDRSERRVDVDLSRDAIRHAPVWDHTQPIKPEYQAALATYYEGITPAIS